MLENSPRIQFVLLISLFFPLFFLLDFKIFSDPSMFYSAHFTLMEYPLPLAAVVCFVALLFMLRIDAARFSAGLLFSLFVLMFFSIIFQGAGQLSRAPELSKYILLMQFLLPAFGLIVGQSYVAPKNKLLGYEMAALCVLLVIVPLEVVATLWQETGVLTPYLYLFSLYQHLHYLPLIFVIMFILATSSLATLPIGRILVLLLAPFMGVYVAASISMLATMVFTLGVVVCCWNMIVGGRWRFAIVVAVFCFIPLVVYGSYLDGVPLSMEGVAAVNGYEIQSGAHFDAVYFRSYYMNGVVDSLSALIAGHADRPDLSVIPSGHNYLLDLIYNFGLISALPILFLLVYTVSKTISVWRHGGLSFQLSALIAMVLIIVLIDSNFTVGLRQPYSGIVSFFLWGRLLSLLEIKMRKVELV